MEVNTLTASKQAEDSAYGVQVLPIWNKYF